uniref:Calmodulin n=1 Tax=Echinostoma caproni TaxID=27848 RepID=A0A183AJQ1_9TREM
LGLTARELQEFEVAFNMLDKNKSGQIEKKELAKALDDIGEHSSSKELNDMFQILENLGKSKKIGFEEFCQFMKQYGRRAPMKKSKLREAFQKMDHDGNGKLERREIRDVLEANGYPVNSEEIERIMSSVDKNGDGYIDYDGMFLL